MALNLSHLVKLAKLFPPDTRTHYSVILHRNKIVAIGEENRKKTHPQAKKLGYKYPTIHSELAAFMELDKALAKDAVLVNLRISPTGQAGMAKPCRYCLGWVTEMFKEVWYTNQDGILVKL
jgi:pyrimidine deaminase RibD-like protein